jgi:hypothetical protein
MKSLIAMSALAAVLSVGAVADANTWTRNAWTVGPYGGVTTLHSSGGCVGNGQGGVNCTRTKVVTGPYGRTATRTGSASCANGTCSVSGVATGVRGRTYSYSGTLTR